MARKPEGTFKRALHAHLKGEIYMWSIHDSFQSGVPDCWYSGCRRDLWAEYKYYDKDKQFFDLTKPEKKPKLTRLQQEWLNARYDEGRNVCVIVGMPSGGLILKDKGWMRPHLISIKNPLMSRKDLADWIRSWCN